ncbi:hypothetical protein AC1031_020401 [Aphanomyces cochlioides]|nr:hypothetical protein AC1031_020401 [Aphanomyces cochlioides]
MTATTKNSTTSTDYYSKHKAYYRAYYRRNRDALLAYARESHVRKYPLLREAKIRRAKENHMKNRERKLAQMRAYYQKTKGKRTPKMRLAFILNPISVDS